MRCVFGTAVALACALAPSAMGAVPFSVLQLDFGGGLGGQPLFTTGQFYQDPMGDNLAPDPASIVMFPTLEFDSYVGLDSFGPSTPTYFSNRPMELTPIMFGSSSVTGAVGQPGGVPSSNVPFAPEHSVFIGRFTMNNGATLFTEGLFAIINDAVNGTQPYILPFPPMLASEEDGATLRGGGAEYQLSAVFSEPPIRDPNFDTYDLYIITPAPSAAAGLLLFGVVALRRRR